jgi:hypothetical protein
MATNNKDNSNANPTQGGSISPAFAPYQSPFNLNGGGSAYKFGFSIHSNNRGSAHGYFGRSPTDPNMGGGTPLWNLINSQHNNNSPGYNLQNSPNMGAMPEFDFIDIENDRNSEDKKSIMSSLSYDSYCPERNIVYNQTLKGNGGTTILNKNLEVESKGDITIENVNPAKLQSIFDDLGSKDTSSFKGVKIEKAQIAGETPTQVSDLTRPFCLLCQSVLNI